MIKKEALITALSIKHNKKFKTFFDIKNKCSRKIIMLILFLFLYFFQICYCNSEEVPVLPYGAQPPPGTGKTR